MRKLLVSTGTMVSRYNQYNYRRALNEITKIASDGLADGLELMMLPFYYDKQKAVTDAVRECGVTPVTIHCEKEVGTMLSDAGALQADGKTDEAEAKYRDALVLFRQNCAFAEELGIPRMVFHLWGGLNSDCHVDYNISKVAELAEIAIAHGTRLLFENIPSQATDPRTNWHKLLPSLGECGLIFDTRFGCLHTQSKDVLTDAALTPHIEHIHISDFGGGFRDFKALRPILHPGEGNVDFDEIARLLDGFGYASTVTLESPVAEENGELNVPKLRETLAYLKKQFKIT